MLEHAQHAAVRIPAAPAGQARVRYEMHIRRIEVAARMASVIMVDDHACRKQGFGELVDRVCTMRGRHQAKNDSGHAFLWCRCGSHFVPAPALAAAPVWPAGTGVRRGKMRRTVIMVCDICQRPDDSSRIRPCREPVVALSRFCRKSQAIVEKHAEAFAAFP
ncbi:MAG: hypothetical protein KDG44_11560, partial [Burkholderiaceae bacterium]|nr:hypothetical protein [Burkholderiaceae bacterium]